MLKEILKHTKQYLENDVIDWIIKKALQCSKNDYWEILSITTNLFYDETIKKIILPMNKYKNCSYIVNV